MSFELRRERVGGDIERFFSFALLLARERFRDGVEGIDDDKDGDVTIVFIWFILVVQLSVFDDTYRMFCVLVLI
jgi:hypothetical protein